MNFKWLGPKITSILSEPGELGLSWGRVASTFTTTCAAVMLWYHLKVKGEFPTPEHIRSLTEFALGPYGTNKIATKVSDMIAKFSKKDSPTP